MFNATALTIVCSDRQRSERFYEHVLGAEPISEVEPGACRWFRLGDLRISIVPNGDGRCPAELGKHPMNMLWLEVDSIARAAEHLARHDVDVLQESDGQTMLIRDPDGLTIEVWEKVKNDAG